MQNPNVHTKTIADGFRCLQDQLVALRDDPRQVIGQSAVRERDLRATLENDDFGVFVLSAQTSGCAHAAGNATDNQNSHLLTEDVAENASVLLFGIWITLAEVFIGHAR